MDTYTITKCKVCGRIKACKNEHCQPCNEGKNVEDMFRQFGYGNIFKKKQGE